MASSSDIAVRVTGLSKKFRKGEAARPRHLLESLNRLNPFHRRGLAVPQAREAHHGGARDHDFWALKDVSFELPKGEVLGIIGRNGAGKSTLLKILSRITPPTAGTVEVHGRLGALLEVGTGFHSDLTGRENIFLNGAILGMSREEIRKEFDSIVDFSGVEEFVDTPVKHYSSGMYMRLAFAVAAHLRNEVLIVDEVLAVGDAEFQRKCLGKMGEVVHGGRTILLVSHNMAVMQQLSTRMLYLKEGQVVACEKDVQGVIARYMTGGGTEKSSLWLPEAAQSPVNMNNPVFKLTALAVVGDDGTPLKTGIKQGDSAYLMMEGFVLRRDLRPTFGYHLYNESGICVCDGWEVADGGFMNGNPDMCSLRFKLPAEWLNKGGYRVDLCCDCLGEQVFVPDYNAPSVFFDVETFNSNRNWTGPGVLAPPRNCEGVAAYLTEKFSPKGRP